MTDNRNSVAGNVYSNNRLLIDRFRLSSARTEAYRQTEAVLWPFHVQTVRLYFIFLFLSQRMYVIVHIVGHLLPLDTRFYAWCTP